jgi:hypothetical protein
MSLLREKLGLPSKWLIRERFLARSATPNPRPLLVFGNQKSGTTAIASLLGSATGKRTTVGFAGAWEPHIGRLVRGETSMADFVRRNAWSFSFDIVKEPGLTFVAPELMDHFGVDRAVFILRHPYENIRSILDRMNLPGDLAAVDPETIKVNRTWRNVLNGRDLGLADDHYVATLARRWLRAAEIFHSERDRFVLIRYEDFVADKAGTIARLAESLGLAATHDISALIDIPFQRPGRPRDPALFFGRKNLARIDAICGPAAGALGYAAEPSQIVAA